jgi:hypothetical protein
MVRTISLIRLQASHTRRPFHHNSRLGSLTNPHPDPIPPTKESTDIQADGSAKRLQQLLDFMKRDVSHPSIVWSRYNTLLLTVGHENVPLDVHQTALRLCTSPGHVFRGAVTKRARSWTYHRYENRFQSVIRNMRAAGLTPTLDDCHFILEQFAATGYYPGSLGVYKEMIKMGLTPGSRAFGLCLQAISHRLTLPIREETRPSLTRKAANACHGLLLEMWRRNIRLSSVKLDLTIRILKDTANFEGFQFLMKLGYGIDLSFPDHPPLELMDTDVKRPLPTPQRFSTSALNTTIDFLGQLGLTSKMVQAFEVLTQPLQHSASSLDDDDDSCAPNPPEKQTLHFPHATPNTTTYYILLKHVSRLGHVVFARHYLRQAMWYDHITDRKIRGLLAYGAHPHEIPAPHFSINRKIFLPVFGLSNREKNRELMRRVAAYLGRAVKRKRSSLEYYTDFLKQQDLSMSSIESLVVADVPPPPQPPPHVLDLDLDAEDDLGPPPEKKFNLGLHVHILRNSLKELEDFQKHVTEVSSRTIQKIKSRLGRRVGKGKDIFLFTSGDERTTVSQTEWRSFAHFQAHLNKEDANNAKHRDSNEPSN